jgi:hypothetical protein
MLTPTASETDVIKDLLRAGKNITLAVPDDLDARDVSRYIKSTCSLLVKSEIGRDKLTAVLGRLLVLARKNKEVWGKAGYDSFSEFLQKEVVEKFGISRSTMYEAKKILTAFPDLTMEQYGAAGSQKLLLLSKFTSQSDSGSTKLIKAASEKSYDQLKEYCEEKGYLGADDATGASFVIKGSLSKIKELRKFLAREDIRAVAESDDPLTIILAMTQEVDSEWTEQGAEALKGKKNAAAD